MLPWDLPIFGNAAAHVVGGGGPAFPVGALGIWNISDIIASPRAAIPNSANGGTPSANLLTAPRRLFSNANFYNASPGTGTRVDANATAADGSSDASTIHLDADSGLSASDILLPAGTYTFAIDVKRNAGSDQQFIMAAVNGGGVLGGTKTATAAWQSFAEQFVLGAPATVSLFPLWTLSLAAADFLLCDVRLFSGSVDHGALTPVGHIYLGKNGADATSRGSYAAGELDMSGGGMGLVQLQTSTSHAHFTTAALVSKVNVGGDYQPILSKVQTWQDFSAYLEQSKAILGPEFSGNFGSILNFPGVPLDLSTDGYHGFILRYDGTTLDLWFDDLRVYSDPATLSAVSIADMFFGAAVAPTLFTSYKFAGLSAHWASALSDSDVRAVNSAMRARALADGVTSATVPQRVWCPEGDSITGAFAYSYPYKSIPNLTPKTYTFDRAITSSFLSSLTARAPLVDAVIPPSPGIRKFILSVLIGANENLANYGGSGPTAFLADLATYCDARRAAGWKVIVCTILPRTGVVGFNAARATINSAITGSWTGVHCDAIADFASDATMGPDAAASDVSLYADGLHPTSVGHGHLEPYITAAVNSL